jgi:hypothetical protein
MRKLLLPFIFLLGLVGCGGVDLYEHPIVGLKCYNNNKDPGTLVGPFFPDKTKPIPTYSISFSTTQPWQCRTTAPIISENKLKARQDPIFYWTSGWLPQFSIHERDPYTLNVPDDQNKYILIWYW